jgi:hypothetical protein
MKINPVPAMRQNQSGMLKRALGDPGVLNLVRSLHLDLEDPATLNGLLAMTQRYVDASSEVSLGQKQMLALELAPGQSGYARDAIRTYLEIAEMK